jgi:hypothetical protein
MATKQVGAAPVAEPDLVGKNMERKAREPEPRHAEDGAESGLSMPLESSKRRMPEKLRRYLLKVQGGKLYLPAAYRIAWFRDECPDWGVSTTLVEGGYEAGYATVQSVIYNPEGRIIASGLKTESKQDFPAGWVEKAETGSIARALAVAGFGTQFTPELDEEGSVEDVHSISGTSSRRDSRRARDEADRMAASAAAGVWEGPGQCPKCHAPTGKRHGRPCIST